MSGFRAGLPTLIPSIRPHNLSGPHVKIHERGNYTDNLYEIREEKIGEEDFQGKQEISSLLYADVGLRRT